MEQSYSAGVGQEVRADGLDVAAGSSRELADSLEVLVGGPAGREGRQSLVDLGYRHIDVWYGVDNRGTRLGLFKKSRFFGPSGVAWHAGSSAINDGQ